MANIKPVFKPAALKAKLDVAKQQAQEQQSIIAEENLDPLVEEMLEDSDKPEVLKRIAQIDKLLAMENTPLATCRTACKAVMQCLADNTGSVLELESNDIATIVNGFKVLADAETQQAIDKMTKTPKAKAPKSDKAKRIAKMAKELQGADLDLDFL